MCVSRSLTFRLETKMPWCQTPSQKMRSVNPSTAGPNKPFGRDWRVEEGHFLSIPDLGQIQPEVMLQHHQTSHCLANRLHHCFRCAQRQVCRCAQLFKSLLVLLDWLVHAAGKLGLKHLYVCSADPAWPATAYSLLAMAEVVLQGLEGCAAWAFKPRADGRHKWPATTSSRGGSLLYPLSSAPSTEVRAAAVEVSPRAK